MSARRAKLKTYLYAYEGEIQKYETQLSALGQLKKSESMVSFIDSDDSGSGDNASNSGGGDTRTGVHAATTAETSVPSAITVHRH